MFDQPNDQNNQQQDLSVPAPGGGQDDQQYNPAAPPANHDFNPKPAYDSVFDEQPQASDAGSLSSDDTGFPAGPTDSQSSGPTSPPSAPVQDNELLSIKQQALQELSPLVGQLEQDPEEKFHTTMRIIQASDNHSLVKEAYEAARKISDDKVRAQALLDIVNEINYFTKDDDKDSSEQSSHNQ